MGSFTQSIFSFLERDSIRSRPEMRERGERVNLVTHVEIDSLTRNEGQAVGEGEGVGGVHLGQGEEEEDGDADGV